MRTAWDSLGIDTSQGMAAIEQGLDVRHLDRFLEATQLPRDAVLDVLRMTSRQLKARVATRRLTPIESERLWRLAKVHKKAVDLFEGDAQQAVLWLQSAQAALRGQSPLQRTITEPGASEVEDLMGRIEHGVFS